MEVKSGHGQMVKRHVSFISAIVEVRSVTVRMVTSLRIELSVPWSDVSGTPSAHN